MMHYIITGAELLVLILCVGFFTSSETAYLSLPRLKLRSMVEQGRRNAKKVAALKANMDRLLTTVLIGTNFLNSLASAIATALAIELLGKQLQPPLLLLLPPSLLQPLHRLFQRLQPAFIRISLPVSLHGLLWFWKNFSSL